MEQRKVIIEAVTEMLSERVEGRIVSLKGYHIPEEVHKWLKERGWFEWKEMELVEWLGMYADEGNHLTKIVDSTVDGIKELEREITEALMEAMAYFPCGRMEVHYPRNGRLGCMWKLSI